MLIVTVQFSWPVRLGHWELQFSRLGVCLEINSNLWAAPNSGRGSAWEDGAVFGEQVRTCLWSTCGAQTPCARCVRWCGQPWQGTAWQQAQGCWCWAAALARLPGPGAQDPQGTGQLLCWGVLSCVHGCLLNSWPSVPCRLQEAIQVIRMGSHQLKVRVSRSVFHRTLSCLWPSHVHFEGY